MTYKMLSVRVAIRIRPFSRRELKQKDECVVQKKGNSVVLSIPKILNNRNENACQKSHRFLVDFCFDSKNYENSSQEYIYKEIGIEIIKSICDGYNACILAYGYSATGKTYTMIGVPSDPGLTPRICQGLFDLLNSDPNIQFRIAVSFLEVYNEKVRDLLKKNEEEGSSNFSLRVREHPKLGPYVQDLSQHIVTNSEELLELLNFGHKRRTIATTENNMKSSRSHAVFTLSLKQTITQINKNYTIDKFNKIHLVDLAGSERANGDQTKAKLKEGANINKSLVTLGNVISALAGNNETKGSGKAHLTTKARQPFVPYRNSVLTWLLKDSLGGNSNTVMIATVSPASSCFNETVNTLNYAKRTKRIINRPIINEDPKNQIIRKLKEEILKLRSKLFSVEQKENYREMDNHIERISNICEKNPKADIKILNNAKLNDPLPSFSENVFQSVGYGGKVGNHTLELKIQPNNVSGIEKENKSTFTESFFDLKDIPNSLKTVSTSTFKRKSPFKVPQRSSLQKRIASNSNSSAINKNKPCLVKIYSIKVTKKFDKKCEIRGILSKAKSNALQMSIKSSVLATSKNDKKTKNKNTQKLSKNQNKNSKIIEEVTSQLYDANSNGFCKRRNNLKQVCLFKRIKIMVFDAKKKTSSVTELTKLRNAAENYTLVHLNKKKSCGREQSILVSNSNVTVGRKIQNFDPKKFQTIFFSNGDSFIHTACSNKITIPIKKFFSLSKNIFFFGFEDINVMKCDLNRILDCPSLFATNHRFLATLLSTQSKCFSDDSLGKEDKVLTVSHDVDDAKEKTVVCKEKENFDPDEYSNFVENEFFALKPINNAKKLKLTKFDILELKRPDDKIYVVQIAIKNFDKNRKPIESLIGSLTPSTMTRIEIKNYGNENFSVPQKASISIKKKILHNKVFNNVSKTGIVFIRGIIFQINKNESTSNQKIIRSFHFSDFERQINNLNHFEERISNETKPTVHSTEKKISFPTYYLGKNYLTDARSQTNKMYVFHNKFWLPILLKKLKNDKLEMKFSESSLKEPWVRTKRFLKINILNSLNEFQLSSLPYSNDCLEEKEIMKASFTLTEVVERNPSKRLLCFLETSNGAKDRKSKKPYCGWELKKLPCVKAATVTLSKNAKKSPFKYDRRTNSFDSIFAQRQRLTGLLKQGKAPRLKEHGCQCDLDSDKKEESKKKKFYYSIPTTTTDRGTNTDNFNFSLQKEYMHKISNKSCDSSIDVNDNLGFESFDEICGERSNSKFEKMFGKNNLAFSSLQIKFPKLIILNSTYEGRQTELKPYHGSTTSTPKFTTQLSKIFKKCKGNEYFGYEKCQKRKHYKKVLKGFEEGAKKLFKQNQRKDGFSWVSAGVQSQRNFRNKLARKLPIEIEKSSDFANNFHFRHFNDINCWCRRFPSRQWVFEPIQNRGDSSTLNEMKSYSRSSFYYDEKSKPDSELLIKFMPSVFSKFENSSRQMKPSDADRERKVERKIWECRSNEKNLVISQSAQRAGKASSRNFFTIGREGSFAKTEKRRFINCIPRCNCKMQKNDFRTCFRLKAIRSTVELNTYGPGKRHCASFCTFCREKDREFYFSTPSLNSECAEERCRLYYYGLCPCSNVRLPITSSPRAYMEHLLTLRRFLIDKTHS